MIDAGAAPAQLVVGHVEIGGQEAAGALDAVAKANGAHRGSSERDEGQDAHGVGVVQNPGARAQSLAVAQNFEPDRAGAERLEDSAGADGVADALIDAVSQGNLVVVLDVGQSGDLDGVHDKVAAFQQLPAVRRGGHVPGFPRNLDQLLGHAAGQIEPALVDIDQTEFAGV